MWYVSLHVSLRNPTHAHNPEADRVMRKVQAHNSTREREAQLAQGCDKVYKALSVGANETSSPSVGLRRGMMQSSVMEKLRELDEIEDIKMANRRHRDGERERARDRERMMEEERRRRERDVVKMESRSVEVALGKAEVLHRQGKSWEVS